MGINNRCSFIGRDRLNSWINKVDLSWSGAILVTLVINHKTGDRKFVEKELEKGEINSMIRELTN